MILRFEKNCSFLPTLALFYKIFQKYQHINLYIFNLYVILTFKSYKKVLKIFFLAVTRLILEKKYFSQFLHNFSKKLTSLVTPSSLQLQFRKLFCNIFFVTLQSMTVPNFMSKTFSYQDLRSVTQRSPWRMIRQKYPGADRVKMHSGNSSQIALPNM